MINLDEIILKSQDVYNQLNTLKNQMHKEVDVNENEMQAIQLIASKHPIEKHILSLQDDYIKRMYITALISIVNNEESQKAKREQFIFVGRILAGFDSSVDIVNYINNTHRINMQFMDEFAKNIIGELAICFTVDALLICSMSSIGGKSMELALEYISLNTFDKGALMNLCGLVTGILEQKDEKILDTKNINLNHFVGYMINKPNGYIIRSLQDISLKKEKFFILNAEITNLTNEIDIDAYNAKSITFYKCYFSSIRGIKSNNTKVNFYNCKFENIEVPVTEKRGILGNFQQVEKAFTLINIRSCDIINTVFENCSISEHLLKIERGMLKNCQFIDCTGKEITKKFLIHIKRGKIEESCFERCIVDTDRKNIQTTTGGIVLLESGIIDSCQFISNKVKGNSGYGRFANYHMYIVKLVNSHIKDSSFNKCYCTSEDTYDRTVKSYILGLRGSTDKNVEFIECQSYHWRYSDRGSSYNKGEI